MGVRWWSNISAYIWELRSRDRYTSLYLEILKIDSNHWEWHHSHHWKFSDFQISTISLRAHILLFWKASPYWDKEGLMHLLPPESWQPPTVCWAEITELRQNSIFTICACPVKHSSLRRGMWNCECAATLQYVVKLLVELTKLVKLVNLVKLHQWN